MMNSRASDTLFYPEAVKAPFSLSLHAMRGIASLIVLLLHVQNGVTENLLGGLYTNPFNGMTAVTFFFALSGLVLGISIAKRDINFENYVEYGIRRFFRIMPLLAFTVTIGGAYVYFISPYMRFHFPNDGKEFTVLKWISGYVGYSMKPNPPIWSMHIEIVASILLPFMILSGRSLRAVVLTGLGFLVFACLPLGLHNYWNFFMIDFFMGASILLWGPKLKAFLSRLDAKKFWMVVGATFAVFYLPRVLLQYDYAANFFHLFEAMFIVLFIAIVFYCPEKFTVLTKKSFQFLGDISYSLYLTHAILLILLANAFAEISFLMDHRAVFAVIYTIVAIPLSLYLASLTYKYVELPGMAAGKRMAGYFRTRFGGVKV